jgi:hypothetical protein
MGPFDPPVAGELNPEPGLLSGPDGHFVLYGRTWSEHQPAAEGPRPQRKLTDPPPP